MLLCFVDNRLDVIGDLDDVGADTLLDAQGNVCGAIKARVAGSVLEDGSHGGDVSEVDGFAASHGQQQMIYLLRRDELSRNANIELGALGLQTAG